RSFVGSDHLTERAGGRFVRQPTSGFTHYRRDAARVDQTIEVDVPAGVEQVARSDDIRVVDCSGVARPQSVIGCDMKHAVNAAQRSRDRRPIAQITAAYFDRQAVDLRQSALRPDEDADFLAARDE